MPPVYDPQWLGSPEPWQTDLVRGLKSGALEREILIRDFDDRVIGRAETMTRRALEDGPLLETFVRWRNQNRGGWLDQRVATLEGTRRWLEAALADDRRINCLLYFGDRLVGRAGFVDLGARGYMSDGIVRGERGGGMNFMHFVNFACMGWDFEHLRLSTMYSKILVTNDMARGSTSALGYRVLGEVSLLRSETSEGAIFTEISNFEGVAAAETLQYLACDRECFEAARERAWASRSFHLS